MNPIKHQSLPSVTPREVHGVRNLQVLYNDAHVTYYVNVCNILDLLKLVFLESRISVITTV